nr:hypothetical protein [Polaromonas sp. E10S]
MNFSLVPKTASFAEEEIADLNRVVGPQAPPNVRGLQDFLLDWTPPR